MTREQDRSRHPAPQLVVAARGDDRLVIGSTATPTTGAPWAEKSWSSRPLDVSPHQSRTVLSCEPETSFALSLAPEPDPQPTSLAAALLDDIFEHSAGVFSSCP